ncbi:MAG: DUF2851 family protein [Chloroflexi bacterium]|nr:DUF2851 family protein [Chloroflexota bacterium]
MWTLSSFPSSSSSARSPALSEAELAEIWQQRAYRNHYLVDCCGRHLQVVFPGRRWGGPGPDFVGAVLAQPDGTLLRGDIELHLRASSWTAHRHAMDPAYSNVILHVVQAANTLVLDGHGGHVPTVQLELFGPATWRRWRAKPERVPCLRQARSVLQVVEAAGRERFQARVARFEGDLNAVEADQVVWRGVAEALGFGRNARPFGQLAEAVPWSQAAAVAFDRGPVGVAGLLLGAAGLLAEATLPEAHAWRALQRGIGVRPMLSPASWDRGQSRAANAPEVRCRGLAELAVSWRRGPAQQILEFVSRAGRERCPRLWPVVRASPWIGPGRAQVIAINVLLPFAAAAGVTEANAIYERVAGEPSNRVLRYMARQLAGGVGAGIHFRGACHQQGLLQLFHATCASRACERCPARAGGLQQASRQPRLSKD